MYNDSELYFEIFYQHAIPLLNRLRGHADSSDAPSTNRPKVGSDGRPQSDSRMNSADVREALHKVPGKDR